MEYIVIAFRSRTETLGFSEFLKKRGIENSVINTPKSAGVGCGTSVKIDKNYYGFVKNLLIKKPARSLAGIFLVKTLGGKTFSKLI